MKYKGQVIEGKKIGRTIGFPTLNTDPILFSRKKEGVYLVKVIIDSSQSFFGLLYYGPRHVLNESKQVLEMYLLDTKGEVNTTSVTFNVLSYMRPVILFSSLEEAQKQQMKDLDEAKRLIQVKTSLRGTR